MIVKHNIAPLFDNKSKILILGSFPSVKSRETEFFYGHPQNRFWKVVSSILNVPCPTDIESKKRLLAKNHIAVWDVIKSCSIQGSSDSSIKDVIPNDINRILNESDIKTIFANGSTAYKFYIKYCFENTKKDIILLPSTSPANAAYNIDRLIKEWSVIKDYLL